MTCASATPPQADDQPSRGRPDVRRRVRAWRVTVVLAIVVQCAVLYMPTTPDTSGTPMPPWSDLVVHAGVFFAATFALLRARLPLGGWAGAVVVALSLVHAVVSELVQHALLEHRTGDVADALADAAGVGLALVAHLGLGRLSARPRAHTERRARR